MKIISQWWNSFINLFSSDTEAETKEVKEVKTDKDVVKVVRASTAIKMITESIKTETDSGKKKYKSRLSRELNKAIEAKDKLEVSKSVLKIVKYLNK
ncbi:MAG: hypothetical protein DRH57_01515 [Candidatus Cloacimonadota bacterium]|nr:MAG: hypothetical protein DRH57_01515 [Candidatus Cloacimonadota bacterium]